MDGMVFPLKDVDEGDKLFVVAILESGNPSRGSAQVDFCLTPGGNNSQNEAVETGRNSYVVALWLGDKGKKSTYCCLGTI